MNEKRQKYDITFESLHDELVITVLINYLLNLFIKSIISYTTSTPKTSTERNCPQSRTVKKLQEILQLASISLKQVYLTLSLLMSTADNKLDFFTKNNF